MCNLNAIYKKDNTGMYSLKKNTLGVQLDTFTHTMFITNKTDFNQIQKRITNFGIGM